mgnify:FL=1
MKQKIVMSYSGGKDSSLALYELGKQPNWEVVRLMTTASLNYGRSSMHGIRTALAVKQAEAIGIPLDIIWLDNQDGAEGYERKMKKQLQSYLDHGIRHVAFGDLYLEDIKAYREKMNATVGMSSVFPVWGRPTKDFAKAFIDLGFKAIVVCVDTTQLDAAFCGREFNEDFLNDLPDGVDWCAENGEFHTFCYDGPIFKEPVPFQRGEKVLREGRFQYIDIF